MHKHFLAHIGLLLVTAIALVLPMRAAGQVHAAPARQAAAASQLNFDTMLSGPTTDKRYTVNLEVARSATDGSVQLTVTLTGGQPQNPAGSTYQFSLPARDLVVGPASASLDTHKDLGAYGHVSAKWTVTSQATSVQPAPCFGGGSSSTIQRTLASGSAVLALSFPCEGKLAAQLHGTNLDIDTGQLPPITRNNQTFTQSIEFTSAVATKKLPATAKTQSTQINVGGYQISSGPSLLFLNITTTITTTTGLTSASHFASDALATDGLTTGNNPVATLNYSGALGKASLTFTGKSQAFSFTLSGACINVNASAADKAKQVSLQTAQTAVKGSVNLTACVTIKTPFEKGDMGSLVSTKIVTGTSSGTGSGSGTGTSTGGGPVSGFSSGGMSISKVSPADGTTGVPTTTAVSVTLSATPKDPGGVTIILTEATNPTGIVMLPPATYDAGSKTATSTPPAPLKPNTKYKLQVIAMGASGGFASASATFTTGS